jgi:hypothetical protein
MLRPLLLLVLLVAGCDLFGEDKPTTLVLGEHLAHLRPGDDSLLVVSTLGTPQTRTTDARGNRHWRYSVGEAAGLTVMLSDSGVVRVRAEAPYVVRSREGVGLGSTAAEVLRVWGPPTRSNELDTLRYELYVHAERERYFGVEYRSDRVAAVEVEAWDTMPGIVWGESIEGVRIGDSMETVVSKLGPPDYEGYAEDLMSFQYFNSRGTSLRMLFGNHVPGLIWLLAPDYYYPGHTSDGIHSRGTPRTELWKKYGKPSALYDCFPVIIDYYYNNLTYFQVHYTNNVTEGFVTSGIVMGYGIPRQPNLLITHNQAKK